MRVFKLTAGHPRTPGALGPTAARPIVRTPGLRPLARVHGGLKYQRHSNGTTSLYAGVICALAGALPSPPPPPAARRTMATPPPAASNVPSLPASIGAVACVTKPPLAAPDPSVDRYSFGCEERCDPYATHAITPPNQLALAA